MKKNLFLILLLAIIFMTGCAQDNKETILKNIIKNENIIEESLFLHNINDAKKLAIALTQDNRLYYSVINKQDIIIINHVFIPDLDNETNKIDWTYHSKEDTAKNNIENNIFIFISIFKDNSINKLNINKYEIKRADFIKYKDYYIAYKMLDRELKLPLKINAFNSKNEIVYQHVNVNY